MPRTAPLVLPGVAHHVTQRGTNRQNVFLSRGDRRVYLELLEQNSRQEGLRVLAYCLMPNHVHLIAVPDCEDSLAIVLRRTHGRYAQYWNARKQRSGHVWQNRFYSCPLGRTHLTNALAYVERNPVRAGMVALAEEYEWSSAAAHLGRRSWESLLDGDFWQERGGAAAWQELLRKEETEDWRRSLRRATYAGRTLVEKPEEDLGYVFAGENAMVK